MTYRLFERAEYPFLPEVTISAFTETGIAESSIIVPLQRAYTGRKPVISSRLADTLTPCATLGTQGLLDRLNITLGTSFSLDNPFLSSLLEDCITKDYDFGMTYGHLRQTWYTDNWSTIRDELCRRGEKDGERRRKALIGNQIVDTWLPPRRVWDLYSNRVVPYWIMNTDSKYHHWPRPISHAWMDEKDRTAVWTPINGYEWPVPIPKDADLNLIRIEMLNLGLVYVWLDVLCLRQVGGPGEDIRTEEWKLDVPTIGGVYNTGSGDPVCYLSGLGQPLTLKEGDLESDRSWFRRAWILQEVGYRMEIAGDTLDGPLHAEPVDDDGNYENELLTKFHEQLQSAYQMSSQVCATALVEMQKRVSTNPVDKVAGLAILMMSESIPAYYESVSLEEAWTALVNSMNEFFRGELFLYAEPGDGGPKWRPSWEQVMRPLRLYHYGVKWPCDVGVDRDETRNEDSCNTECIEGLVRGLAVVEGGHRHGEFIVECNDGIARFKITAVHTYPIHEDTYTMIHIGHVWNGDPLDHAWVVGQSLPGGKFEKVSVLEISEEEQCKLQDLGITKKRRYVLI